MESESDELIPCELGTKEYWDAVYERDSKNYTSYGDPGEVWFGEMNEDRIIRWILKNGIDSSKKIIDLGTGNGLLLIGLAKEGYTNLTGIDYSDNAIKLAEKVANAQSASCIKFKVEDLLSETSLSGFDLALDKGTYDAISLNPEGPSEARKTYISNISKMLVSEGLLLITSCNWTSSELVKHFESDFKHINTIPTPTFQFGGSVGNIVSCIILQKNL